MVDTLTKHSYTPKLPGKGRPLTQFMRFCSVGIANTLIDIGVFTGLSYLSPTHDPLRLVVYSAVGFLLGAVNSLIWNRHFTFQRTGSIPRFLAVTFLSLMAHNALIFVLATTLPTLATGTGVWPIALKVIAILGTFLLTFVVMRLWVFIDHTENTTIERVPARPYDYSLSLVLPAYNEDENIMRVLNEALNVLPCLVRDFEVIVVNDGSTDRTEVFTQMMVFINTHVRLVNHDENKGYGAALVTGFEAATKDLTCFMDADGQFHARSLVRLLPYIGLYDAVFGYRIKRQDSTMRKLNAWCWKSLVWLVFNIRARDIDCAFKVFQTEWLHAHLPESRGAMINTELLYRFAQDRLVAKEVGVPHYPRVKGVATGAKPQVILKALRELTECAVRWSA